MLLSRFKDARGLSAGFPTHDTILANPTATTGSRWYYSFVKDKKIQKSLTT